MPPGQIDPQFQLTMTDPPDSYFFDYDLFAIIIERLAGHRVIQQLIQEGIVIGSWKIKRDPIFIAAAIQRRQRDLLSRRLVAAQLRAAADAQANAKRVADIIKRTHMHGTRVDRQPAVRTQRSLLPGLSRLS